MTKFAQNICPICDYQAPINGLDRYAPGHSDQFHFQRHDLIAHIFTRHGAMEETSFRGFDSFINPSPVCPCGYGATFYGDDTKAIEALREHLEPLPDADMHLQEAAVIRAAAGLPVTNTRLPPTGSMAQMTAKLLAEMTRDPLNYLSLPPAGPAASSRFAWKHKK